MVTYMVSVRFVTTTVTETGAVHRTLVEGVLTKRSLAVDFEVTGVGLEPTACGFKERSSSRTIGVHWTRNKTASGLLPYLGSPQSR